MCKIEHARTLICRVCFFNNKNEAQIIETTLGYLASQYVLSYDGLLDSDVYDTGFAIISSSAKQGLSFEESTQGFCAQQMSEEARRNIYDAARFEADLAGGAYDQGADGAQLPMDEWEDGGYNELDLIEDGNAVIPLRAEDKAKLDQWKYRPEDSLYLKYKTVYDNPKYYDQKTGAAIYPGTNGDSNTGGFTQGVSTKGAMQKGQVYKRYGYNGKAKYYADADTSFDKLSLPPGSDRLPLLEITVLKEIPCREGEIAPWFDQQGRGKQYFTDAMIDDGFGNMVEATLENLKTYNYIEIRVIE